MAQMNSWMVGAIFNTYFPFAIHAEHEGAVVPVTNYWNVNCADKVDFPDNICVLCRWESMNGSDSGCKMPHWMPHQMAISSSVNND
jgi:hypothetical protein